MVKASPSRADSSASSRIQRGLEERSGWWDRVLERPLVWGLAAVVGCTWLLVPTGGPRLPAWAPGEVAAFDVIVPQDLTLPDEAATEAVRAEARAAVLPVYDLDPRLGDELGVGLQQLFAACREQLEGGELAAGPLAAAAGLRVDEPMVTLLRSSSCSPGLEAALLEVVSRVYRGRGVDDARALERRGARGRVVRNLAAGTERVSVPGELADVVDLSSGLEGALRTGLLEQDTVARRWIKPAVEFLRANLVPNLVFSRAETGERVRRAAEQVAPRSQVFRRGQVLVRRGDTVTPAAARTLRLMSRTRQELTTLSSVAGIALVVAILVLGLAGALSRIAGVGERRSRVSMILLLLVLFVAFDRFAVFVVTAVATSGHGPAGATVNAYLWAVPHAAGPVTVALLLGAPPAAALAVCMALAGGLLLGGEFLAVVYVLVSSLVGVLAAQRFGGRHAFAWLGTVVGLANVAAAGALELYRGLPGLTDSLGVTLVCAFVGGPLAVGVATLLQPLLEGLFGITTDLRLLELSNQNLPLLRRLSQEAPGTFQHSLAVSHLAEAGANSIGASALLLRVCAYYHDVGKLIKPSYFIENQRGANPHDALSPSMSALVIISHVKEGLELARGERLPLAVRQAIATHHGTKVIHYFFNRARERGAADKVEVRDTDYRYPGPKPHSKELGILLLADAVEAAARTLDNPTPSKIEEMVDRIFSDTLADGQLDSSALTFSELDQIATTFVLALSNMYHHRIDYPGFDFNRRQARRDSGSFPLGTKTGSSGG